MDNRITKKRVSNFLAYEWILILFLCVACIFVWELVYTVSSVRLTVGQQYKFYYDYYVVYDTVSDFYNELAPNDKLGYGNSKSFSYDIQSIEAEKLYEDNDVLSVRTSAVQEGDMLFTDDSNHLLSGYSVEQNLAKLRVDSYLIIMSYDKLYSDAEAYLKGLLIEPTMEIKGENLDPVKVKKGFDERLGSDNRFRTEEQKAQGLEWETERLKKLCEEVKDFKKILELSEEYFFTYTRYTQNKELAVQQGQSQEVIDGYEENIQREISAGRENARYGLRLDKIGELNKKSDGSVDSSKVNSTKYFCWMDGEGNVYGNIIAMVFDFKDYQPELQYESIVVINNIVRMISTVLD